MMSRYFHIVLLAGITLLAAGCPTGSGPGSGSGGVGAGIVNVIGGASGGMAGPPAGDPSVEAPAEDGSGITQDPSAGGGGGSGGGDGSGGGAASAGTTEATPTRIAGSVTGVVPHDYCDIFFYRNLIAATNEGGDGRAKVRGFFQCTGENRPGARPFWVSADVTITSPSGAVQRAITTRPGGCFEATIQAEAGDILTLEGRRLPAGELSSQDVKVTSQSTDILPCACFNNDPERPDCTLGYSRSLPASSGLAGDAVERASRSQ